MNNDITALMPSMKAAAEKATLGRIGGRIDGSGSILSGQTKHALRAYNHMIRVAK
ncbi:hypothetical protein [Kluyvera ascorbata]|uniref:hypothetical protein n=1 Tax=Kluyvera ascorbata TaxID=51288 RepID=UPI00289E4E04|nr:hypothetical protein [Kluyvera ascorbata]